jgi:hypothetical protein
MSKATDFVPSVSAPTGALMDLSTVGDDVEALPVFLTAEDGATSRGLLWRKRGTRPKVGVHVMHPRTDQSYNYNILPLVEAGYAVLGRAGRWPNNDVATIHELLVLDVAAGVRYLRAQGCEQVVLLGNSGGGPLATFYQSQARRPLGERLTDTPAGDPLDLNNFDLPPADGLVLIGTHLGEGRLMAKCLDASVVDESDPIAADPALDIYDPRNGFVTPPHSSHYDSSFLDRYRAAQLARARRIDALAMSMVDRQRNAAEMSIHLPADKAFHLARTATAGWHLVIYRTMADPAMVDLSIDPDDRCVRSYAGPRPDLENYGENGFARYLTPRAWLSTWSPFASRADTEENCRRFSDPLILIHYAGDCGMRLAETQQILAACASPAVDYYQVPMTDHYGQKISVDGPTAERSPEGTARAVTWMTERFPL